MKELDFSPKVVLLPKQIVVIQQETVSTLGAILKLSIFQTEIDQSVTIDAYRLHLSCHVIEAATTSLVKSKSACIQEY